MKNIYEVKTLKLKQVFPKFVEKNISESFNHCPFS